MHFDWTAHLRKNDGSRSILLFMFGIVIATHCQLGEALIEAAEFIIGKRPGSLESVSIDLNENAEKLRKKNLPENKEC